MKIINLSICYPVPGKTDKNTVFAKLVYKNYVSTHSVLGNVRYITEPSNKNLIFHPAGEIKKRKNVSS